MSTTATAVQQKPAPEKEQAKAIIPRDPFEEFDDLFRQIERRAYEIFQGNGRWGHELDDWLKAEGELLHPVHMKVSETDKAITVDAEVPGFEAKDLAIGLEGRRLTITGKRETKEEQKKGKTAYEERCSNEILRMIDLPANVDAEKAEATLKNGVLEMQLPKTGKPLTRQIRVKVG